MIEISRKQIDKINILRNAAKKEMKKAEKKVLVEVKNNSEEQAKAIRRLDFHFGKMTAYTEILDILGENPNWTECT